MSQPCRHWVEALRDPCFTVRCSAARALGELGEAAREAVPDLIEALADPEPGVRDAAAAALGALGRTAKLALPFLAEALHDPNRFVRQAAARALEQIDPAAAAKARAAGGEAPRQPP
jgi:HEAT repeat protein